MAAPGTRTDTAAKGRIITGRHALSVPFDDYSLAEHADIAREAESLGYTDAWSYEVDGTDCFAPLAAIAGASAMRLGTAIANVYTRAPATLAQTAAGIAELAPGRFNLGIGSGSSVIVERWNGCRFDRPATRVREMVQVLRLAFAGERVVFHGRSLQIDGFRLSRPPSEPIPIHVAGLRPRMLKVAGEVADGAILNWLSADDVRQSVAVVRDAAAAAGRDPATIEIMARLFVHLDPPGPQGEIACRRYINSYLNVPVYQEFHRWLGRGDALEPVWRAWAAGDRRGAVEAMSPEIVDDLIVRGSPADRNQHVSRYLEAGVNTVFLQFLSSEPDVDKRRGIIRDAIRDMSPAFR